ncbi:MAG: FAD-binding protein, partial [Rhodospirillaceae bacterium]|nr:FAD-binding protein [Rhodospirillaceae bacterium]
MNSTADTAALEQTTRADVIINGGGLVGLSQGIAVADAGLQVIVIDREDPATMLDAPYDGRSSAIAWA